MSPSTLQMEHAGLALALFIFFLVFGLSLLWQDISYLRIKERIEILERKNQ